MNVVRVIDLLTAFRRWSIEVTSLFSSATERVNGGGMVAEVWRARSRCRWMRR